MNPKQSHRYFRGRISLLIVSNLTFAVDRAKKVGEFRSLFLRGLLPVALSRDPLHVHHIRSAEPGERTNTAAGLWLAGADQYSPHADDDDESGGHDGRSGNTRSCLSPKLPYRLTIRLCLYADFKLNTCKIKQTSFSSKQFILFTRLLYSIFF